MLGVMQVREVSESGRRSYEAYIMAPGVSKDNIKWGSPLHTAPATPSLYLQHGPAGSRMHCLNVEPLQRISAPRSAESCNYRNVLPGHRALWRVSAPTSAENIKLGDGCRVKCWPEGRLRVRTEPAAQVEAAWPKQVRPAATNAVHT